LHYHFELEPVDRGTGQSPRARDRRPPFRWDQRLRQAQEIDALKFLLSNFLTEKEHFEIAARGRDYLRLRAEMLLPVEKT
jgi:hypothetical protein